MIVTTRPSGRDDLEGDERLGATIFTIAPLSDHAISALLVRWCELYERHREGTYVAAARGRATGEALARDVLASPSVRALATSPLLATVIAIVHRAGVRLPDRRVELYDHVLRILVERWNQVRTRDVPGSIPLRLPDAIRLLGPVALEMIEQDREGAIEEPALHGMLARSLAAGNVRGIDDAGVAIDLFRRSLGLLVERAPGVYGFLHQTLVEFLAAHELVRTGRFVGLAKNPRTAFKSEWREVILLGTGILGVVQANDERLSASVRALVAAARARPGRPSASVPRLLGDILADDPALTESDAQVIIDELVPKWWFNRRYQQTQSDSVFTYARNGPLSRRDSQWREQLARRLRAKYRTGVDDAPIVALQRNGRFLVLQALDRLGVEIAPLACQSYCQHEDADYVVWSTMLPIEPSGVRARTLLSPGMQLLWRQTAGTGAWKPTIFGFRLVTPPYLDDSWLTCEIELDMTITTSKPFVAIGFSPPKTQPKRRDARAAVLRTWHDLAEMFPDYVKPDS